MKLFREDLVNYRIGNPLWELVDSVGCLGIFETFKGASCTHRGALYVSYVVTLTREDGWQPHMKFNTSKFLLDFSLDMKQIASWFTDKFQAKTVNEQYLEFIATEDESEALLNYIKNVLKSHLPSNNVDVSYLWLEDTTRYFYM